MVHGVGLNTTRNTAKYTGLCAALEQTIYLQSAAVCLRHALVNCRAYLLGEQVVHVGDADAVRQLLASEHKLVEVRHAQYLTQNETYNMKSIHVACKGTTHQQ